MSLKVVTACDSQANKRFLFTSPEKVLTLNDSVTDRESVSLGAAEYDNILSVAGFELQAEYEDEGQNHYYDAEKR